MKNKVFFQHLQPLFLIFVVLINLGTFFYVAPLSQNLSDLGNLLGHPLYLILWGTTASIYFYIYTLFFAKKSRYSYRIGYHLLSLSCLFMILSVWIPYLPYEQPQLAKWHIRIAMLGTVLYILILFHMLTTCLKSDVLLFQRSFPPFTIIVFFDLLLYLLNGGVSTLLETSFTIATSCYLYYLAKI